MSRRDQIRMTDDEVQAFLAGRHTMNVATIGKDGRPHLVAMWYGFFEPRGEGGPLGNRALGFWTYGKSQKILNLQRDPRMTCLVETGDEYAQLRGVEIVGTGEIVTDRAEVMEIGRSVFERYTGPWSDAAAPVVEQMGAKRHAVRIVVEKLVTWDHTKLGGVY
jgi:PPOX class probable F420-dependent enzyme